MKVIKAAAVQISPVLYSREGTVEKVARKIHELGQQGVRFATFPETVYYPYFSVVQTPLQDLAGTEHLKLLDQAVTVPSSGPMRSGRPPERRASWYPSASMSVTAAVSTTRNCCSTPMAP